MGRIIIGFFDIEDNSRPEVHQAIQELSCGYHTRADAEVLQGSRSRKIFSYRVTKPGRLLFTYATIEGQQELFILEYLPHHEYKKSRFLNTPDALRTCLENHTECFETYTPEQPATLSPVTSNIRSIECYNGHYIELSSQQEEAIHAPLPAVVMGVAGSGKSCVAMSLITQYTKTAERTEDRQRHRVCYMTQNEHLLAQMRSAWMDQTRINPVEGFIEVSFLSYNQWIRKQCDPSIHLAGFDDFKTWYEETLSNKLKINFPTLSADAVYKELRVRSGCESNDEYMALGARQSSTGNEEGLRAYINFLYENYRTYLENKIRKPDPSLYPIVNIHTPTRDEDFYEMIIVDEAQDCSRLQLRTIAAFARDNKVLFCMDPHQDLMGDLSRTWICSTLFNTNVRVSTVHLGQSYRCPQRIAEAATAMIALKYQSTGGATDKAEARVVDAYIHEEAGLGHVFALSPNELEQRLPSIYSQRAQAHFAVVVWDKAHRIEALRMFEEDRVFTPAEIKGLEFPIVLLFRPFDTKTVKLISNELKSSKSPSHDKRQLNKTHLSAFNELITACTRSTNILIFCGEEKNTPFFTILADTLTRPEQYAEQGNTVKISTDEEWDEQLVILFKSGAQERAQELHTRLITRSSTRLFLRYDALTSKTLLVDSRRSDVSQDEEKKTTTPKITPIAKPTTTPNGGPQHLKQNATKPPKAASLISPKEKNASTQAPKYQGVQIDQKIMSHLATGLLKKDLHRMATVLKIYPNYIFNGLFPFEGRTSTFFGHIMNSSSLIQVFIDSLAKTAPNQSTHIIEGSIQALAELPDVAVPLKNKLMVRFMLLMPDAKPSPALKNWLLDLLQTVENNAPVAKGGTVSPYLYSALYCLSITDAGLKLLASKAMILHLLPPQAWDSKQAENEGIEENGSPAYWMCGSDLGRKILNENQGILKCIPSKELALTHTDTRGSEPDVSAIFWLCSNEEGQELLVKNPDIIKNTPPEILILARTANAGFHAHKTPLICLCMTDNGLDMLKNNPSIISQIPIDAWTLTLNAASGAIANVSPLYLLTTSCIGRQLLKEHPEILQNIPVSALYLARAEDAGPDANETPLLWLCATDDGRDLLINNIETLKEIPAKAWALTQLENDFFAKGTSPLHFLSNSVQGIQILNYLLDTVPEVLGQIPITAWKKSIVNQASPFISLKETGAGLDFLRRVNEKNHELYERLMQEQSSQQGVRFFAGEGAARQIESSSSTASPKPRE